MTAKINITDNGDFSRLREGIRQRLELLSKAQWILAHHALTSGGLRLGQCLVRNIDITQIIDESRQLQKDGGSHGISRRRGTVLQVTPTASVISRIT